MIGVFNKHFMEWAVMACREWGYPDPSKTFYERINKRLPEGVKIILGRGITEGIIITQGHRFSLKGLPVEKGPYSWFSRYSAAQEPSPNWEYFTQVALYSQLYSPLTSKGLTLAFEDEFMDLAIYAENRLAVYIEVKEKATQIKALIAGIKKFQDAVDFSSPDRGNDPLRKAKYFLGKRPEYFCGFAIGARFDYKIRYPSNNSFSLEEDIIPWM